MASYLSGERYEILPPVLYTPDLGMVSSMMQVSTAKYNAARANIEKLYGDLYYGDLSNLENRQLVNDYFERLQSKLNELSTYNLADPRVAEEFRNLVKPVVDDKKLMYDYAFSKDFKDKKERIEQLKTTIPSKDNGYVAYDSDLENMIYNKKREYSLLTRDMPDEMYAMPLIDNVNGFNAYAYFNDFAKDNNLKIKNAYIVNANTGDIIHSPDVFKGVEVDGQVIPNQYIIETENGVMTLPEYADAVMRALNQSPYTDYVRRKTEATFYNNLASNGYDYDKAYRAMVPKVENEIKKSAYYKNITEEILNLSKGKVSGEDVLRAIMEETKMFYDKPILDYLLGDEAEKDTEGINDLKDMLENIEKGYLKSKEGVDPNSKVYGPEDYTFLKSTYEGLKRVNGYFDIGMTYANSKFSKTIKEDESVKSIISDIIKSSGKGSSSQVVSYEANVFNYEDLVNVKDLFNAYLSIKNDFTKNSSDVSKLRSFLLFTSVSMRAMKEIDPNTEEGKAELERYLASTDPKVKDENFRKYTEGYNLYQNYKNEKGISYNFSKISSNPIQPSVLQDKAFVASSYNSERGIVLNLKDAEEFLIAAYGEKVDAVSSTGSNVSQSYPIHYNTYYDSKGNKYSVRYNMKLVSSSGGSEEVKANSAVVEIDVIGPDGKLYGNFKDFMNDKNVDQSVKKAVSVGAYSTAVVDLSYSRDKNLALAFSGSGEAYRDAQRAFSSVGSYGGTQTSGSSGASNEGRQTEKNTNVSSNVNSAGSNISTRPLSSGAVKSENVKNETQSTKSGKDDFVVKSYNSVGTGNINDILKMFVDEETYKKLVRSGRLKSLLKDNEFLRNIKEIYTITEAFKRLGFTITSNVGESRDGGKREHNGIDVAATKQNVAKNISKYSTKIYVEGIGSDNKSGGYVRFRLCLDDNCQNKSDIYTVTHIDHRLFKSKIGSFSTLESLASAYSGTGNLHTSNKDSIVLHITSDRLKDLR